MTHYFKFSGIEYWTTRDGRFMNSTMLGRVKEIKGKLLPDGKYQYPKGRYPIGVQGMRNGLNIAKSHAAPYDVLGKRLFLLNAGLTGYNVVVGETNILKGSTDIGAGAIGVYGGPAGFAIGTMYYLIDVTIGWDNAFKSQDKMLEKNQEILGPQFNLFRDGGVR